MSVSNRFLQRIVFHLRGASGFVRKKESTGNRIVYLRFLVLSTVLFYGNFDKGQTVKFSIATYFRKI